ncbi:signal peptidase I [Neobacillus jeddahensis]|uniref:signal peptidase I n=1 Tax=Neobacillus jeddahensis TaxID=1461580 RepID=UPI00058BDF30|nr:signal peptidase I [Neobacillus jeddahensis]
MRVYVPDQIVNEHVKSQRSSKSIVGWIPFTIIIILLFFIFRFAIGIEIINGHSMNPTIENKSVLFVNKIFFTPKRGDIVVIKDPHGYNIIKRIIGMPNDKVIITNGIISVNGQPLKENYTRGESVDVPEVIVPGGEVFVVGDNRSAGESLDSRDPNVRTFSIQAISGKAVFSLYPFHSLH